MNNEFILRRITDVCPNCEEESEILVLKRACQDVIKGETIESEEEFCRCAKCNDEYQTAEQINKNLIMACDTYRKKHNLLTSSQIKAIRNKFGVSQTEFAFMLGLGEKTIARYETKQIQEESNDRLMKLFEDDYNFVLYCLKKAKDKFETQRYEALIKSVKGFIELNNDRLTELSLSNIYLAYDEESDYNGFKLLDIPKIKSMIAYFVQHTVNVFKVKLMKLLWYCDAKSYLSFGHSMTGLVYTHAPFGALPIGYRNLMELNSVDIEECLDHNTGDVNTRLIPKKIDTFDMSLFTNEEIGILQLISKTFKNVSGRELSDIMHREDAYTKTDLGEYISFSIINNLKAV